jgi:hypothetical protein
MMEHILWNVPVKGLLLVGWVMFLLSLFLPVNVSIGGLTDPGQSHLGFINLFYSFFAVAAVFEVLGGIPSHVDVPEVIDLACMVGLGLCNLLLLVSPMTISLTGSWAGRARLTMVFAALYVCTVGFFVYRTFPLRYGHYVWCLSFMVVAVAFIAKLKQERRLA